MFAVVDLDRSSFINAAVLVLLVFVVVSNIATLMVIRKGFKKLKMRLPVTEAPKPVELRTLLFYKSPAVQSILYALASGAGAGASVSSINYSIASVVRDLKPSVLYLGSSKIAICSLALGKSYKKVIQPCLDSHLRFAEYQGHSYILLEEAPMALERPPAWMKIPLILSQLNHDYEYVFYVDADAMITNLDQDIWEYVNALKASNKTLLITEDETGVNSGVMFFANTFFSRCILELIWLYDADIKNGTWEQNSLRFLINHFPAIADQTLIELDRKKFNSFPPERNLFQPSDEKNLWSRGDFICHFSGIRQPDLERYIRDYSLAVIARNRKFEDA